MALDIHRLDNHDHLFGIDDIKFKNLNDIFTAYKHWTGISINQYDDTRLTVGGQQTMIKIIDDYVKKTNLNQDKAKTTDILEFRGLLTYFIHNNYDIEFFGD